MSPFATVAQDADRVDVLLAGGFLVGASGALAVMRSYIATQGPEGLGAAYFEHCCLGWLARVIRLADIRNTTRAQIDEPWADWFATAARNRKIARELAFARKVCGT